jgi:hypothetical protein
MISEIEKTYKKETTIKEPQNLRKSVYKTFLNEKEIIKEEKESLESSEFVLKDNSQENFLNVKNSGIKNEDDENFHLKIKPNQMVRKSILSKNIKVILKNSISCREFSDNKLISQDQVDQDVSNLKKLKQKLAIIEEKEKNKKVENKKSKRKAKLKKKINPTAKANESTKTQISSSKITKSKESESKENELKEKEESFETKESKQLAEEQNQNPQIQYMNIENIEHKEMESIEEEEEHNFRILSK